MLYYIALFFAISSKWIYNDQNKWGGICKSGLEQSPINLLTNNKNNNKKLIFNFKNTYVEYFNNGVYLEAEACKKKKLGYFIYSDNIYYVTQFHFHSVSEHTINYKHYPMELHIVANNYLNKNMAVISLIFDNGINSKFLQNIGWDKDLSILPMPLCKNGKLLTPCNDNNDHIDYKIIDKIKKKINFSYLNELLKDNGHLFYHYRGSLTTPPCTEGVDWFIYRKTLPISKNQLKYYTIFLQSNSLLLKNHYHNNRDITSINDRNIDFV